MTLERQYVVKRALTIEVRKDFGNKYYVNQAKGLANRRPRPGEEYYLNKFKNHINRSELIVDGG